MIRSLGLLLVCQLVGEVAARSTGAPVPGPLIGLVLLVLLLFAASKAGRISADTVEQSSLGRTAAGLLAVLGILFVPAGVGVVQHAGLLLHNGVALATALVVSTLATLVVTVWVFIGVSRAMGGR
jgi:putative effector of murein hydrolase LrgA (UPF0299 family)